MKRLIIYDFLFQPGDFNKVKHSSGRRVYGSLTKENTPISSSVVSIRLYTANNTPHSAAPSLAIT